VGIILAYFIGKRFHRIAGVFAAAFVAFLPPYVEESHYATPDIVLTAAILAGVLAAMVYVSKPTIPLLLVTSLMATLSIMAKYPGALLTLVIAAVVIAAAIRDRAWLRIASHGAISIFAVGLFLFILSPVMFTNRHVVLRRITHEARSTHLGADGLTFPEKLIFYASNYFSATGVILLVLSIAGVWFLIRHWKL
jgi:4-amino-4-deoxy-L-arabinose transferase-like glycosyltransferase